MSKSSEIGKGVEDKRVVRGGREKKPNGLVKREGRRVLDTSAVEELQIQQDARRAHNLERRLAGNAGTRVGSRLGEEKQPPKSEFEIRVAHMAPKACEGTRGGGLSLRGLMPRRIE